MRFQNMHKSGQSLIEVLIAVALGAIMITAAAGVIAPALRINTQTNMAQAGAALGKELLENVRVWAEGDWHNISNLATSSANHYYLSTKTSPFSAIAGSEAVTVSGRSFTRYFYADDVRRDGGDNIVSSGGSYDPSTKKITIFYGNRGDGTLGAWSTTTQLLSKITEHSAVVYNGYIYTTGGEIDTSGTITSTVQYVPINSDGTLGEWSTTTQLPIRLSDHSSVVYNGYIYVTGGNNGSTYISTVYHAKINSDGTLGEWSTTTQLPSNLAEHSAVVYNGYIYTTGGATFVNNRTSTVYYSRINSNGTLGAWSTTTQLPSKISEHSAVVYNGYIYTTGGEIDTGGTITGTSTVQYAPINSDGMLGEWSTTTQLPSEILDHSSVVYNGYIYTTGGETDTVVSTVQYAPINSDGTLGAWSTTTQLPSSITDLSAVVYNGYIYTTGGELDWVTGPIYNYVYISPIAVAKNAAVSSTISSYITRNRNNIFNQTDWSGGSGQNGPATTTNNLFSTSTNIAHALISGSISIDISFTGALDPWNSTTPLPIPMVVATGLYNDYIYVISAGATDECSAATSTVVYGQANSNGTVSSWGTTTQLPAPRVGEAFVAYNGYAYVIAGKTSTVLYAPINPNGTLGLWTATTPLPTTLNDHASVAYNGYMYTLGGRGNSSNDTSTVLYAQINGNGTLGSWTRTTALPGPNSWLGAVAYNGYLYQVGGYYNSDPSNIVNYAPINGNGTLGIWSETTNVPATVEKHALVMNNGYLYIVGGTDNWAHRYPSTSTVRYAKINGDGTLGSWIDTTALPSNVQTNGAVFYNNYLFSIGGNVGNLTTGCTATSTVVSAKAN